jgi:phosphatidylglycerol:prolipoprotein diacylglycerol transferase
VYPVLFRIGDFENNIGVLVALGALFGLWIFQHELRRRALPESGVDAGIAGVLGGLAGAKVLWSIEHAGDGPIADLLLSRGGMSWFGGLMGGVAAGVWMLRRRNIPLMAGLAAASPALAVGHAIGRIGCFLVGDDYGRPTDLPWGVAFPMGLPPTDIPVHPTQLYEMALTLLGAGGNHTVRDRVRPRERTRGGSAHARSPDFRSGDYRRPRDPFRVSRSTAALTFRPVSPARLRRCPPT